MPMVQHQRILTFTNGFNFRDLGGYQTTDGQQIGWHRLIRSAHLSDFTPDEQRKLYGYGIRTIIDLRSSSEVATYPDQLTSLMQYIRIPVFDNDLTESNISISEARKNFSADPKAGFNRMMAVYRQFVTDEQAQTAFHRFIQTLCLHSAYGGILFHCSAGKDRSGLATIYLLNLLQVPESVIFTDYMLTNKASVKRVKERLRYAVSNHLGDNYLRSIYDLSTANQYYYKQALTIIDQQYGGMQHYLHDVLQISDSMVEQLKYLYLSS